MDREMSGLPRFYCKIKEVFADKNGITAHLDAVALPAGYKPGDEVELRKPDGSVLRAESGYVQYNCDIHRFENPGFEPPTAFYFRGLNEADVPCGTEVWQITEHKSEGKNKHWRIEKVDKPGKHD